MVIEKVRQKARKVARQKIKKKAIQRSGSKKKFISEAWQS